MSDQCSLTWKTFPEHLQFVFQDLYRDGRHTDVTLVSDDQTQFKAHKIVLSACSPVFQKIIDIDSNPSQHPLIYLRGIQSHELESILQFMYLGEGRFYRERMGEFFKAARDLQVKDIAVDIELSNSFSERVPIRNRKKDVSILDYDEEEKDHFEEEKETEAIQTVNQSRNCATATEHEDVNRSEIFHEMKLKNINEQYSIMEVEADKKANETTGDLEKENDVEDKKEDVVDNETTDSVPSMVADSPAMNDDIKYPCNQCNFQATLLGNLQSHIQYKHDGVKYPCNECNHQSTTKSSLKVHIRAMHEGVKHPCNQCEFKAGHLGNLQRHVEVKHTEIKHHCDQCDYRASTKEQVKLHIRTKHEGLKYPCHLCDHQSLDKSALNTHIKSKHEGVKHPCDQCGKQFSHMSGLYIHMKSVHGGQRFPCDQCGHQATQLANLKAHIKKHHEAK